MSYELARELLKTCHTLAVVGAHVEPGRAATYVPDYLEGHGYRILPVNPFLSGQEMFGHTCVATLDDLPEKPDMVVFFRRSQAIPDYLEPILRLMPSACWLQLGIIHEPVARQWREAGIRVIQNRCALVDHQSL